jgi:hypothetical protein
MTWLISFTDLVTCSGARLRTNQLAVHEHPGNRQPYAKKDTDIVADWIQTDLK